LHVLQRAHVEQQSNALDPRISRYSPEICYVMNVFICRSEGEITELCVFPDEV
jgi:hypothetical protein